MTSLMKMAIQSQTNTTSSKTTLPGGVTGNSTLATTTTTTKATNKTKVMSDTSDDNIAKLEKEKDKLAASLANLKLLDNSLHHQPPSNPTPTMHFNNTILADTEDTQEVTHDFSPIKDMKDRAKTMTEVFKQNGSVILAPDGSSKHLFIPDYHDALKFNNNSDSKEQTQLSNETLSSATKSTNLTTATFSGVDLQNSTILQNVTTAVKNSTADLQEEKYQQRDERQEKLMTYMKGMSKSIADINNITTVNTTTEMDRYSDDFETSNHLDKAEEVDRFVKNTNKTTYPKDEDPSNVNNINNISNKTVSLLPSNKTAKEMETTSEAMTNIQNLNLVSNLTNTRNTTLTNNTAVLLKQEDSKQQNKTEPRIPSTTSEQHTDLKKQNHVGNRITTVNIDSNKNNKHNNNKSIKQDEDEEEEEVRQIKMTSKENNVKLGPAATNKTVETEDELRQGTADHQQQQQVSSLMNSTNFQNLKGNTTNAMTLENNTLPIQHDANNLKNVTHYRHHHHNQQKAVNEKPNNEQLGKVDNSNSSISNRTLESKKETTENKIESPLSSSVEQPNDEKETTFQMQNTTYKVFDSNPSETSPSTSQLTQPSSKTTTTIKNKPGVSKVEKVSYDKALGIDNKVTNVNNKKQTDMMKKLPKKTPTRVEQQAYRPPSLRHIGGRHQQHQQTKRKLLMNVTLAEAMEKMNPSTPSEKV